MKHIVWINDKTKKEEMERKRKRKQERKKKTKERKEEEKKEEKMKTLGNNDFRPSGSSMIYRPFGIH